MHINPQIRRIAPFASAMAGFVVLANVLVAFPINDFLTWGVLPYPITFLIVDLANRHGGPRFATTITACGFAIALPLSLWLAEPRIAVASLLAYVAGQAMDISVFHHLRRGAWWKAPLISSCLAVSVDSLLFFALAFAGTGVNWVPLCAGDTAVKLFIVLFGLTFYRRMTLKMGHE